MQMCVQSPGTPPIAFASQGLARETIFKLARIGMALPLPIDMLILLRLFLVPQLPIEMRILLCISRHGAPSRCC